MRHLTLILLAIVTLFCSTLVAAPAVDPNLLNATSNTGVDQPAGLSTGFAVSSSIPGDDPEGAFGNNDGPIEAPTFIFDNGRTPDNGDAIPNPVDESVDGIAWSTTSPVLLYGYRLDVASDGGGADRGTQLAGFRLEGELDDLFDNNNFSGTTDRLFAIPQVGNSLEFGVTHNNAQGARINEIDAIVDVTTGLNVAPNLLNSSANAGGDQPAGLSTNIVASSNVLGTDTPEDAFGNNDGAVEGDTFIFGDFGATADNANNDFGDGSEQVDSIDWDTTAPVKLYGYQIQIGGDGPVGSEDTQRSTELVRFLVEGVEVDLFDLNSFNGTFIRVFENGPVTGDDFRIELTRRDAGGGNGQRVFEIDALVPEPTGCILLTVGAVLLIGARRRGRK